MENQLPITIGVLDYGYDVYWGEKGKDLVASPLIQAYRVEGPWQGDDESLYYSFDPTILGESVVASTIEILEIIPTENAEANEDEEGGDSEPGEETETTKGIGKIVANKYGYAGFDSTVTVTITPSQTIKTALKLGDGNSVPVNIDGKYTTLAALSSPLTFCMNKNHRIRIEWAKGLIETFRVVTLA